MMTAETALDTAPALAQKGNSVMKILFWTTQASLAAGAFLLAWTNHRLTTFYYHDHNSIATFAEPTLPFLIIALLASFFRKARFKAFTLFVASAVLLYFTVASCLPILTHRDDVFFPLMDLAACMFLLFLFLVPTLFLGHGFDLLHRHRHSPHSFR